MFTFSLFTEISPLFGFLIDWLVASTQLLGRGGTQNFRRGNLEVLEGQFMDGGKFRLSPGLHRGREANLPSRALGFPGFYSEPFPVSFLRFCRRKFNKMVGFRFLLLGTWGWGTGGWGVGERVERDRVGGVVGSVYGHMCKIDPLIPLGSGQRLISVDRIAAFPGAEPGQGELPGKELLPALLFPPPPQVVHTAQKFPTLTL